MSHVYHGSNKPKLQTLQPRISSHGKSYVYGTKHRAIAILFLSRWNDYLLSLSAVHSNDSLHITLTERYENALFDIFSGKSGYLYVLNDNNFFQDPACWDMELVSEQAEIPVSCEVVRNILPEIKKLAEVGVISLYHYPNKPAHMPLDDTDLIDKTIELYKTSGNLYNATYCIERFPHLEISLRQKFLETFGIDF